ncbi:MAG: glycoside hydrolase family 99-like domain-containing protein [Acidobacteriaceae bacterium]|nr:glycoside hydrolase family 99-like domain-containing protein [Acidobacteriaceae bacterium]
MADDVRLIALYLPQYHPIPENDVWWGEGFTEWTKVVEAKPLFYGHHQPQLPGSLGFYDLRLPEVRKHQARVAQQYGVHGFCYYHYNFNGKRLLERPFNEVLSSGQPDFPFCICWANENWTRRWDGQDHEILIKQNYSPDNDREMIRDLIPAFQDPRYIRVNGRPLLLVYRTQLLPDPAATAAIWRAAVEAAGFPGLYLCRVEAFDMSVAAQNPTDIGFDAACEFPPHGAHAVNDTSLVTNLDPDFAGLIYDYEKAAQDFIDRPTPPYRRFHGVMPSWDNTARNGLRAHIAVNASPDAYRRWLAKIVDQTRREQDGDEQLIFINAWNEWGEGCHLEPDRRYGFSWLEATQSALGNNHNLTIRNLPVTAEAIEALRQRSANQEELLQAKRREIRELQDQLNALATVRDHALSTLKDRDATVTALNKHLTETTTVIAQRDQDIRALQETVQKFAEAVKDRDVTVTALNKELTDATTVIAQRDQDIRILQETVQKFAEAVKDRDVTVMALNKEMTETTTVIAQRDQDIRILQETVQKFTEAMRDHDATVTALSKELAESTTMIAQRDQDVHLLQEMNRALDATLQKRTATITVITKDLTDAMTVTEQRDQDIHNLRGMVQKLGDATNEQEAIVANLRQDLADVMTVVTKRDQDITGLKERALLQESDIAILRHQLSESQSALDHRDQRLHALYNSTSWKLSVPIRKIGALVRFFARLHLNRRHQMTLQPLQDLHQDDGRYVSTGNDPAFLMSFPESVSFAGGWCKISYRVDETTSPLAPVLYIDTGNGYSQQNSIALPPVVSGLVDIVVFLPANIKALRLDPMEVPAVFKLTDVAIKEIGKANLLFYALRRNPGKFHRGLIYLSKFGLNETKKKILKSLQSNANSLNYQNWISLYDTLTEKDKRDIIDSIKKLTHRPLISVVMLVYNTPEPYLRRSLETVRDQLYQHWELCVVDDASKKPHVTAILAEYAAKDSRIKVIRREANGHISAASNTGLELAAGEFIALMDHDDELPAHALYMIALEIERHPNLDIIYSDEDKIDENSVRYDPYFKSDWSPDLLLGQNMVSHLGVYRRSLLKEIGGFRIGYEGSQDYDLVLRAVEKSDSSRIRHIPAILYHWRVFSSSSSFSTTELPTTTNAARRALQDHFDRCRIAATVDLAPRVDRFFRISYQIPNPPPLVTLIVPTRDKVDLLRQCVDGILDQTDYQNIELLIIDNNSTEQETFSYFTKLKNRDRVRVINYAGAFNYSAINNFGVRHAHGTLIGLINNDIKVIEPHWLSEMVSHALRPEVGAVGAKLYYGNDTIQHAGVITGINGVGNHIYKNLPRSHPGYFGRLHLVQNLSAVTAACLITRSEIFEEVGGLDEINLAVAFNDVDFCLRIREKGYLIVWTPAAELYHLESASRGSDMAPDKIERFRREVSYMIGHWGKTLTSDPYYNPNLTLESTNYDLAFPPRIEKPWGAKNVS